MSLHIWYSASVLTHFQPIYPMNFLHVNFVFFILTLCILGNFVCFFVLGRLKKNQKIFIKFFFLFLLKTWWNLIGIISKEHHNLCFKILVENQKS